MRVRAVPILGDACPHRLSGGSAMPSDGGGPLAQPNQLYRVGRTERSAIPREKASRVRRRSRLIEDDSAEISFQTRTIIARYSLRLTCGLDRSSRGTRRAGFLRET